MARLLGVVLSTLLPSSGQKPPVKPQAASQAEGQILPSAIGPQLVPSEIGWAIKLPVQSLVVKRAKNSAVSEEIVPELSAAVAKEPVRSNTLLITSVKALTNCSGFCAERYSPLELIDACQRSSILAGSLPSPADGQPSVPSSRSS